MRGVASGRQGLAFGFKPSAVPVATLVAGMAVPLVALTVGWRWAFLGAVLGPFLLIAGAPHGPGLPRADRHRSGDAAVPALVVLAIAGGLAAAAANSFGAFFIDATVAKGVAPAAAGTMLALASAAGIAGRVFGPLSFGLAAEHVDYATAWHGAGLVQLCGAALVLLGRALLRRDLRRAPDPVEPTMEERHA